MQKGITLVETVVAVSVLIMALGGPFLMAAKSLRASGYAREEVAAARLAEEGLEIVHNMRDNNSAENDPSSNNRAWDLGFGSSKCATGCIIDIVKQKVYAINESIWVTTGSYPSLIACNGVCDGEEHRVYKSITTGLFRQMHTTEYLPANYTKTNMTRVIKITSVTYDMREYKIESIVTYYAGPNIRTITLTDSIMNWFPAMQTLL